MKKEVFIIVSLFLFILIITIIHTKTKLTGYSFLEQYPEEIIFDEPLDFYLDPPYFLSATCSLNISCHDLSFYYFESIVIFDDKTKKFINVTKPESLSDFTLICNAESVDGMHYSCTWNFKEEDYSGDFIGIIAVAKGKDNSTIISNNIIRHIGRSKLILLFDSRNTSTVVASLIILVTILAFWLSNYILNKVGGANKDGT